MLPEPTLPSEPRRYGSRLFLMANDRQERDEWWRALRLAISNAGIIAGFAASLGVDDEFAKKHENAENAGFMPPKIDAASLHAGTENATELRRLSGNAVPDFPSRAAALIANNSDSESQAVRREGGLSELARARASSDDLRDSARRKRPVCTTCAMEEEEEEAGRVRRIGTGKTLQGESWRRSNGGRDFAI